MTYSEYVEENRRKLKELIKLPYEELKKMEDEILNNPNSTRSDIVNIIFARGEKEEELGIKGYTADDVRKHLNIGKYNLQRNC